MKKIFLNIKTIIVELVGLVGGFFWAQSTNWDYEPLILFVTSLASLLITLGLHFFTKPDESTLGQQINSSKDIVKEKLPEKTDEKNSLSNLDARKIIAEIEKTAPYLKSQVEATYTGMRIRWDVSFESIRNDKGNIYKVYTLYKGNYPWVYFDIDIDQYPFFKIAQARQSFLITGKIKHVGGNTFTIDIEEIRES